jgi:hypothetical protein
MRINVYGGDKQQELLRRLHMPGYANVITDAEARIVLDSQSSTFFKRLANLFICPSHPASDHCGSGHHDQPAFVWDQQSVILFWYNPSHARHKQSGISKTQ